MDVISGYIKSYRKILDSAVWQSRNKIPFIVFFYLLHRANHREGQILEGGRVVKIGPGQLIGSVQRIADDCKITTKQARNAVSVLSGGDLKMISVQSSTKYSVYTICNWESYQSNQANPSPEPTSTEIFNLDGFWANKGQTEIDEYKEFTEWRDQKRANRGQTEGKLRATNKNVKKNKNVRIEEKEEEDVVSTCVGAREGEASTDVAATHTPKTKSVSASRKHDMAVADFLSGKIERPGKFDRQDFTDAFSEWAEKRRDLKKFMTAGAITRAIKHLAPYSPEEAVYLLQQSADHCWTGVVFSGTNPTPPPGHVLRRANGKPVANVNPELARIFHQGMG